MDLETQIKRDFDADELLNLQNSLAAVATTPVQKSHSMFDPGMNFIPF